METVYYWLMKGLGADIYNKIRPTNGQQEYLEEGESYDNYEIVEFENVEISRAYYGIWAWLLVTTPLAIYNRNDGWKKWVCVIGPLVGFNVYHMMVSKYNIISSKRNLKKNVEKEWSDANELIQEDEEIVELPTDEENHQDEDSEDDGNDDGGDRNEPTITDPLANSLDDPLDRPLTNSLDRPLDEHL